MVVLQLTLDNKDSQKRNPNRLIFSLPLLSLDGARLWTCVWRPPMQQQQPEEMQHKHPLTVNSHTGQKFQTFGFKASSIVLWFGQQTVARTQQSPEPYKMQQTLKRAVMVNKCQQNHLVTDGSMKFK